MPCQHSRHNLDILSGLQAGEDVKRFFKELTCAAEQLGVAGRVRLIAQRAFRTLLASLPPLPTPKLLPANG
jgi:hypothetical protein